MLCVASTLMMLTGSLALGGCVLAGAAIGDVATVGIGAGVGAVTGSPALGLAAGVAASMGIKYAKRRIQGNVQNAIARAAGPLAVGQSADWIVEERLPLSDCKGTVEVVRAFGRRIPCKEIIFTVADKLDETKPPENIYVGAVCEGAAGGNGPCPSPPFPVGKACNRASRRRCGSKARFPKPGCRAVRKLINSEV